MKRRLHLAAYDVTDPRRLRRMLEVVKDYASGGQKSAYECYLSPAEKREMLTRVENELDPDKDRFACVELHRKRRPRALGKAVKPADPGYFLLQ